MRKAATLLLITLALPAFALDNSAAVKVTPLAKVQRSWDGAPLAYPAGAAEATTLLIELAPGGETGWHKHPVPSFAYVLQGTLEVQLKDGRTQRVEAGQTLAEVVDTWHNGRNAGDTPLKLLVLYTGVQGQALTIKETP